MKIYRAISASDPSYQMTGRCKWVLPGVECPDCGSTWSIIGADYPSVDLSAAEDLIDEFGLLDRHCIAWQAYKSLEKRLTPYTGARKLLPGTGMGPFEGQISAEKGNAFWPQSWAILIRDDTLKAIALELGQELSHGSAVLNGEKSNFVYLEVPVGPAVYAAKPRCATCGRISNRPKDRDFVGIDSASTSVPAVFRAADWPTRIFASEAFVRASQSAGLDGTNFLTAAEARDLHIAKTIMGDPSILSELP
ncbi:MAG: hypothetical protein AMXMBFR33_70050 [Candidatus Xenobia bacterium]